MTEDGLRVAIRAAEDAEPPERWALLCFLAGRDLTVDERELGSAVRRSELLLAAGGDPRRRLELYGRAVQGALALARPPRLELWLLAAGRIEVLARACGGARVDRWRRQPVACRGKRGPP